MARPTDEVKNHIIKCRIGDDLYDRIKDRNVSELIREALEKNFNNKRYNSDTQRALDDIATIVESNGGTFDDFIKDLDERLFWGEIEIEDGVICPRRLER